MNYSYSQVKASESVHQDEPDDFQERAFDGKYLVDREEERDTPGEGGNETTCKAWLAAQQYSSGVDELNFD
jgi:hypothetical protein